MSDEWLTYKEAAERLSISPEAARQKAIRGRWQRTKGNDGKARIRLPDGWTDAVRTPDERAKKRPVRTPNEQVNAERAISALENHVETLKVELAAERDRTGQVREDLERERQRADEALSDYKRLAVEYERLVGELVAEKSKPWWKRLAG